MTCCFSLAFAADVPQAQEVDVVTVEAADYAWRPEFIGRFAPSRLVSVRSRISGQIKERLFEDGASVSRGDVLFRLDDVTQQANIHVAKSTLAESQASLRHASRELKRLHSLRNKQAASQQDLDAAKSESDLARAAIAVDQARVRRAELDLEFTEIKASINGVIQPTQTEVGDQVSPDGDTLVQLRQINPLHLYFSIPDIALQNLKRQQAAGRVSLPDIYKVAIQTKDNRVLVDSLEVDYSAHELDAATGSRRFRVSVPNHSNDFLPGQFVQVKVLGITRKAVIAIPQVAVQDDASGKFVYVIAQGGDGAHLATRRAITPGDWIEAATNDSKSGKLWLIEEGLKPGDQVVVNGMARIFFPGMPVAPKPVQAD